MFFGKIKEIFLFIIIFILFFFIIFLFKNFIFISENETKEEENIFENYINIDKKEENVDFSGIFKKLKEIEKKQAKEKIFYSYFPDSLSLETRFKNYKNIFDIFFLSKVINSKIKSLEISFYKDNFEVRGRLKDRKINIFGIYEMNFKEALAVAIHEFGHFYDIYILKKGVFKDISDEFYSISWDERNILKNGGKKEDFISGYASTNVYEDFAESFTFYILNNYEFKKRAEKSEKLKEKYNFFKKYIFINDEFQTNEFSEKIFEENIWDSTKLNYNFENFKNYLEKIEEN